MRAGKKRGFGSKSCFIAGLVIGVIIGASSLMLAVSYRMDSWYQRITYLEQSVEEKNSILEKLNKNGNPRTLTIKGIEVVLAFGGNEIDKIHMEKAIKEKYVPLIGKDVKKVDPDIIAEVVDKRILKIEDKEYKVKVTKLVLTEVLKIWITLETVT